MAPGPSTARSRFPSAARLGLMDDRAGANLVHLGWAQEDATDVLWALSRASDPDLALTALVRLRDALDSGEDTVSVDASWPMLDEALRAEKVLRGRLLAVLGASTALGDHLVAYPGKWRILRSELPSDGEVFSTLLSAVGAKPEESATSCPKPSQREDLSSPGTYRAELTGGAAAAVLRVGYRDHILLLAAHDLAATVEDQPIVDFPEVSRRLSVVADAALTAALAVAVATVFPEEPCPVRLGVIAMGKCGARELNYISDVDVIFVAEPAGPKAARLAGEMMGLGTMCFFEVDANLRPEGKSGDLVRTLDSHCAYYERWAKTWEFQALLKSRPMTGDMDLGKQYREMVEPKIWSASQRDDFVPEVQAMRRRVEDHIPDKLRDRELKLGKGGLRDVEFAVQLLQMVHGRTDEELRTLSTIDSLAALSKNGYIAREDSANLTASYAFLRTLEHRLQLQRLKRTHLLPPAKDDEAYRWLARAAHVRPDGRQDAAGVLREELRTHLTRIRRLHEKLFYRPLLESIAGYDEDALRLSQDAVERQLLVLGFASPRNAVGHLSALTSGSSRRGRIQSLLLPTLLEWLSDTPDPDAGLLGYRRLSEKAEGEIWYLRTLRDEASVAQRLMRVLGSSPFATELLLGAPETLQNFGDGASGPKLVEPDSGDIAKSLVASTKRHRDSSKAIAVARSLRRAELLRIAAADILGLIDVVDVCESLTAVWTAVIEAALAVVIRNSVANSTKFDKPPALVAVIGMGRLGGRELSYGSDADVLFVCEAAEGVEEDVALRWATSIAEKLRNVLGEPSSDPPLEVDADLRPEGRNGPLVRTLGSYRAYYQKWAETWELQSLLRASFCAGDRELGIEFLHMVDKYRYPDEGVPLKTVQEIRRMKARVDTERLPRGADPSTPTKLGRGGLADVEWTVQLLTMQHAHEIPELHTTSTLEALDAAGSHELISEIDRKLLRTAWLTASKSRNALVLVRGKPTDQLPAPGPILSAVNYVCGGEHEDSSEFLNEYLRITRQAKKVVEHIFWGES